MNSDGRPICCWGPDDRNESLDSELPGNVTYEAVFTRPVWRHGVIPPTLQLIAQLKKRYAQSDHDGIYWFHVWDYAWPVALSRTSNIVLTLHGTGYDHLAMRYGKYSMRYIYHVLAENTIVRRSKLVFAVSKEGTDHTRSLVEMAERDRIKYMPTFVDEEIFVPMESINEEQSSSPACPLVLYTGRLAKEKRLDKAIAAFKIFQLRYPEAIFRIVGSGNLKKILKKLADGHTGIVFVDSISHAEIVKEYQNASLLLLLSEREGIPLTLLESLACGTPVVASGVGGIPEVVKNDINGFIVDPDNPSEVADKMEQILVSGKSMRLSARESILNFRQKVIVKKIWNEIDNICM
jgi:glycosyltransferase involved in cell wall biosynthesis